MAWFDRAPVPALSDDWVYMWDVRHLLSAHQLAVFPEQSAWGLIQVLWSAVVTLGHPEPALLRLSLLPFLIALGPCSWLLGLEAGASRFWALVVTGSVLCGPVLLSMSVGYNTDIAYLALVLGAALFGARWVGGRGGMSACIILCVLATLQRNVGAGAAVAIAATLAFSWRRTPRSRADAIGVVVLAGLVAAAVAAPYLTQQASPFMRGAILSRAFSLRPAIQTGLRFGATIGLLTVPFGLAALTASRDRRDRSLLAIAVGILGLVGVSAALTGGVNIFEGEILSSAGLGADPLLGPKPMLYGAWFVVIELLAASVMLVILVFRSGLWRRLHRPVHLLLVLTALSQLALPAARAPLDRYMVVAVVPLLPLVGALVSRHLRWQVAARGWAVAALFAGVAVFAIGEQDLLAWEAARYEAARLALERSPGLEVQLGYTANALLVEIPYFDSTGRLPPDTLPDNPWALRGPLSPTTRLCFATLDDPRPGATYSSLAPGRVVVDSVASPLPCGV
ncbi:MAG: hypothetical protein QOE92_698 [Chloroflexota bacterium]|nr:hypothetical protein [Chloroflexota bacterium]